MLSFDWLASAVKLYAGTGNAFDWLEAEPSDFGGKHQWRAGCVSVVFLILFTSSGKSSATGNPSVTVVAVD